MKFDVYAENPPATIWFCAVPATTKLGVVDVPVPVAAVPKLLTLLYDIEFAHVCDE